MISNVYGYYLSQYGPRTSSKYSSHKPSELKNIYGKILKVNSLAPFYKLDLTEEAQKYAIDLKENAFELSNTMNELSSSTDSSSIEFKKIAESSDEQALSVTYVGKNSTLDNKPFQIEVKQLATEQVNTGNYLQQKAKLLEPGEYSFDLNISNLTYQFEFNIKSNDTNRSIQDKISRLINRSNLGLKSHIETDSLDNSAIVIESEGTGISSMKSTIFSISSSGEPNSQNEGTDTEEEPQKEDIVNILGLNRTTLYPANAIFSIDGMEYSSSTNNYTINNTFDLTFKNITTDTPVTISFKNDKDAIVQSISNLVDGYNKFIGITSDEKNTKFVGNEKLMHEFTNIANGYQELLKRSGIEINSDGMIEVNRDTIADSADDGTISEVFRNLGDFKNALQSKVESISLNPMNYVNNKIVSYKNPQRITTNPYFSSIYSGMLFNGLI